MTPATTDGQPLRRHPSAETPIGWATAATVAAIGGILAAGVLAGALAAAAVLLAWFAWRRARTCWREGM